MFQDDDRITYSRVDPYVQQPISTFTNDGSIIKNTENYIRQSSAVRSQIKIVGDQMYKVYRSRRN